MIKSIHFPDRTFADADELKQAVKENVLEIMEFKKAQIQKSCDKGISVSCQSLDMTKASETVKAFEVDKDFYYIAVNTTKILDSHDDLHLDGIWNKSVKEQQGKVYLIADHDLEIDKVIVRKEHIEMFVAKIPFSMVRKNYKGETEALIYKIRKDKINNANVKEWLDSGDAIEASVRMLYVSLFFALDSDEDEDIEYKKNFEAYKDQIANIEEFEKVSFFFGIKEAKNVKESSLVVFGSNATTGLITEDKQAEKSLDILPKPSADTSKRKHFIN